jgi:hypothetical protein
MSVELFRYRGVVRLGRLQCRESISRYRECRELLRSYGQTTISLLWSPVLDSSIPKNSITILISDTFNGKMRNWYLAL